MSKTAKKAKKSGKTIIGVYIPNEMLDALRDEAAAARRGVSAQVVWCVQEVLARTRIKVSTSKKDKGNDIHETRGTDRHGH